MPGELQFEEDNQQMTYTSRTLIGQKVEPKLFIWLKNKGIVKDEKQASKVLIIISLLLLLIAVAIPILMLGDFRTFEDNLSEEERRLLGEPLNFES